MVDLRTLRREVEVLALREALVAHGGNVSAVARQLGISRRNAYNLIKEYGLSDESGPTKKGVSHAERPE